MFPAEFTQGLGKRFAVATQRIGMALRFVGSGDFHRGLGHDGAQPRRIGFLIQEGQLLVGNGELSSGQLDAIRKIKKTSFDSSPRHGRECMCWVAILSCPMVENLTHRPDRDRMQT